MGINHIHRFGNIYIAMTPKTETMKGKINWTSWKLKTVYLRILSKKWKDNPQNVRKCFKIIYVVTV